MKILDRYILTSYLKTFISVFLILILIFILQTIWLYIRELAGKDLNIMVIIKFIFYFLPKLIPLVLPLTILLSSIMVFGSFAENYEFAAMKSTGISLQRAMSGLSVFIIILGFTTFLFANNVIPWAEFNSFNLRTNIAKLKPAMLLAEGQFNTIEGTSYNIKFAKKTDDNHIEDVVIHIKGSDNNTLATRIKARNGVFIGNEKSEVLKLILNDGNYYNDVASKKPSERKKHPFAKSTFETYTINIDLSGMNNVNIDDKSLSDRYNMLNLSGLGKAMDSLSLKRKTELDGFSKALYQRSNIQNLRSKDIHKNRVKKQNHTALPKDSTFSGSIIDLFDTKAKNQIVNTALNAVNSTKQIITSKETFIKNENIIYKKHIVSYHEKLALGFACIILFFVGAPLGALIRKGGIGLPMVIAILLFLTYHFIGIFATNSAKNGNFNPILASWFSTLVMLPLGVYLTKRATADRGLFESFGILEFLKKFFRIKKKDVEKDTSIFDSASAEFRTLETYENKKLVRIVKNYRKYNYKIIYRNTALSILNSRGITNQQLKFSGDFSNQEFEEALRLKNKYQEDAKLTLILYVLATVLGLGGGILNNNKFPLIGTTLLVIGIIIEIIFIFSLMTTFISHSNYKKHTGNDSITSNVLFIILGLPLYFVIYFFEKKKLSEDLNLVLNKKTKAVQDQAEKAIENKEITEKELPVLKDYSDHSKFSIILYSFGVILLVLFFVFRNNKLPSLASASIQLSIISLLLYFIYYIKAALNLFAFYKHINKKAPNIILLVLGILLYMVTYPFIKVKIKELL